MAEATNATPEVETKPQTEAEGTTEQNQDAPSEPEDPVKLFVGQVPRQMGEAELTPIFSPFGTINELVVLRDRVTGVHKGCAFITYAHRSAANKAISQLHEKVTLHPTKRPMVIRQAGVDPEQKEDVKLFVGMLAKTTTESHVESLFAQYGNVKEVYLMRDQMQESKGCCFVKYPTRAEAQRAIDALNDTQNSTVQDEGAPRRLIVKFADTKQEKIQRNFRNQFGAGRQLPPGWAGLQSLAAGIPGLGNQWGQPAASPFAAYGGALQADQFGQTRMGYDSQAAALAQLGGMGALGGLGMRQVYQPQQQTRGPSNANLFIYNVPETFSDADLHSMFSICGNVLSATVFKDKVTGISRGFGFVSYSDAASAEKAIHTLNGFQVPGNKRLKVMLKKDNNSGGAGGGTFSAGAGGYGGGSRYTPY